MGTVTHITGPIPRDGAHSVSDAEERAHAAERVRQAREFYSAYGQVNGNGNGEMRSVYKAIAWAVGGVLVSIIAWLFIMQMRANERIAILEIKQTLINTGCTQP